MMRDEQAARTDDHAQREAGERIPNSQLDTPATTPVTLPTRLIYR